MLDITRCATAALILGASSAVSIAADAPIAAPPPETYQPFQVRLRAVGVIFEKGGAVYTIPTGVSLSDGVRVSSSAIPEVDVTYFLTKNLAIEAICCVIPHNVIYLHGGALDGTKVATVGAFPPTVVAQYHWTDFGPFQPYIGIGVNFTHFYSQNPYTPVTNTFVAHDSWGVVGQVGFDYMIDEHWGFNFDVKKIVMNPHIDATLTPGLISVGAQANISPWLIGGGITYRFGGPAATVVAKY